MCEGRGDTRERWTCNFTTFSDKERSMRGEYPYCEFMFRADGETVQGRLREYIRSRGFGPWFSVTTSQKASYRLAAILNFLERHLPKWEEGRRWRIMLAYDFSTHLTTAVSGFAGSAGTFLFRWAGAQRVSSRRSTCN